MDLPPSTARPANHFQTSRGCAFDCNFCAIWEFYEKKTRFMSAKGIVDRLEKSGLAERRVVPHDRRVKLVVLTPRGVKTKTELMEEFLTPPAELLDMDQRDLDALLPPLLRRRANSLRQALRIEGPHVLLRPRLPGVQPELE